VQRTCKVCRDEEDDKCLDRARSIYDRSTELNLLKLRPGKLFIVDLCASSIDPLHPFHCITSRLAPLRTRKIQHRKWFCCGATLGVAFGTCAEEERKSPLLRKFKLHHGPTVEIERIELSPESVDLASVGCLDPRLNHKGAVRQHVSAPQAEGGG